MKTDLCVVAMKKMVHIFKVFGFVWLSLVLILFSIMCFCDDGLNSGIVIVSFALSIPAIFYLFLGFRYEKIFNSCVSVAPGRLSVIDKNGKVWREICYDSIVSVKIEEIDTFYFKYNNTIIKQPYICIYTTDPLDASNIPYRSLLRKRYNMFPILFDEEFFSHFLLSMELYKTNKQGDSAL